MVSLSLSRQIIGQLTLNYFPTATLSHFGDLNSKTLWLLEFDSALECCLLHVAYSVICIDTLRQRLVLAELTLDFRV